MGAGSNGILGDPEWPLTRVSRSLYTYKWNISKRCVLGPKLLKKPYTIYRMEPTFNDIEWPLTPITKSFAITTFFDIEYLRNDTRLSHSYYRTSIGSRMCCIEWWYFQWPWRTPNPIFKVTSPLRDKHSIEHS